MKVIHQTRPVYAAAYPNEADSRYFAQKLLDGITSAVAGMGVVAIFFFLLTM